MSFADRFLKIIRSILPAPFTIAVLLTFVTIVLAYFLTYPAVESAFYFIDVLQFWQQGLWQGGLLIFAVQMMLMLVLGHVLALTGPVDKMIRYFTRYCTNTANAALLVTFLTLIVSFINWGLGLVFGAIFARKVGDYAKEKGYRLNYALIGAAGYSGLMVWHGGLSGSAPIKIAEPGHFFASQIGTITLAETVFSEMNIFVTLSLLATLPLAMYLIGKSSSGTVSLPEKKLLSERVSIPEKGAEKLDHSFWLAIIFAGMILFMAVYEALILPEERSLAFLTPNFINFSLLGLGIALHGNFSRFLKAVNKAITGASGILIQFPLYFGIMGIMKESGLVQVFSEFFVGIANEHTFPLFIMISAGIVNIFVPSGGGQWAVQGGIIIEASHQIGASIPKAVMALAYGDQLTNMMQPFWALPLLGITGLRAKDILPYTLFLMILGIFVFTTALLIY